MELLDFIFQLGVVFAIYGFIWGIIEIGLRLLLAQSQRSIGQIYVLRGVKYAFLANVTFLFCHDGDVSHKIDANYQLILAGIVLLTYYVGKLQNNQNRNRMFQVMGNVMPKQPMAMFNKKAEVAVIAIALLSFGAYFFVPFAAENPMSRWFVVSIIDIENTPIFGFIFKIIGFFFLLNLIAKLFNGVGAIMKGTSRQAPEDPFNRHNNSNNDNQGFDDYEELN